MDSCLCGAILNLTTFCSIAPHKQTSIVNNEALCLSSPKHNGKSGTACFIYFHIVVNIERTAKLMLIFPAQIVLSNFGLKLKTNPFLSPESTTNQSLLLPYSTLCFAKKQQNLFVWHERESNLLPFHIVVNIERTAKLMLIFPAQIVLSNFGLKLKTNPFLSVIIFECKRIMF
jgi:hypothetical protein